MDLNLRRIEGDGWNQRDRFPHQPSGEVVRQFVYRPIAIGWISRQAARDDGFERGWKIGTNRPRTRSLLVSNQRRDRDGIPIEWQLPGQSFEEHDTDAEDVRPSIDLGGYPRGLLWAHVMRSTDPLTIEGCRGRGMKRFGDAEIENANLVLVRVEGIQRRGGLVRWGSIVGSEEVRFEASGFDHDVGRLEIAVDDTGLVGRANALEQFQKESHDGCIVGQHVGRELGKQSSANQFRNEVRNPLPFPHVKDSYDIGVGYQTSLCRLASIRDGDDALGVSPGRVEEVDRELEGYPAADGDVFRLEDKPVTSFPQ